MHNNTHTTDKCTSTTQT